MDISIKARRAMLRASKMLDDKMSSTGERTWTDWEVRHFLYGAAAMVESYGADYDALQRFADSLSPYHKKY